MSRRIKIVTWNVNGIRACAPKGMFSYLRREDPDFLCLQETKAHPDQLDESFMHPEDRFSFWSSAQKKGYSGVVTYARNEPQSVGYGIGVRKFDSEGRFVVLETEEFALFNVYFPNGGSGPERHAFKQEFLARFMEHLCERVQAGREIVLVGDYNVAYLDSDVYDPVRLAKESGFLPEERQWFREFLSRGFVDTFRLLHPKDEGRFSWWSYRDKGRIGNRGWRIDHICVSKGLSSRVKRAEIQDDVTGSDHCPVLVEIEL